MKRHIVVIEGHPDPSHERLNHALADTYAAAAQAANHDVRRIAVGLTDFPILRTAADFQTGHPPAAIAKAQEDIAWADHVAIFYPLWHGDMPALLKAFIEQTFRPGFSMDYGGPGRLPKQLLRGKSARIVVTMGMPPIIYRWMFGAHSLKNLQRNILGMCGMRPVRTALFGVGMTQNADLSRAVNAMEKLVAVDAAEVPQKTGAARAAPAVAAACAVAGTAYLLYTVVNRVREAAAAADEAQVVIPDYEAYETGRIFVEQSEPL